MSSSTEPRGPILQRLREAEAVIARLEQRFKALQLEMSYLTELLVEARIDSNAARGQS